MKKIIGIMLLLPLLGACGPIFGQMMRVSEGVEIQSVEGATPVMKSGEAIVVVGPFAVGDNAYTICRGEIEEKFTAELNRHGMQGELHLARRNETAPDLTVLKQAAPDEVRTQLSLKQLPDYLLIGTLLQRSSTVAPMRGVIMDETYRFELVDLRSHGVSRYEIHVRGLAQKTAAEVAGILLQRLGLGRN